MVALALLVGVATARKPIFLFVSFSLRTRNITIWHCHEPPFYETLALGKAAGTTSHTIAPKIKLQHSAVVVGSQGRDGDSDSDSNGSQVQTAVADIVLHFLGG